MSGGYFNYEQYKIDRIADDVENIIKTNDSEAEDGYGKTVGEHFSPEVIEEIKDGLFIIRMAAIYAQRIDWLVSGDDGEESFLQRLKEDLGELGAKEEAT